MKQDSKKPERTLNKKMLERLIIIHNAIKAGMFPDVPALQKLYCEQTGYNKVGEATIYRDIDLLRTYFHAPLEFNREKGGYYYFDEEWDFALNSISADDVFYLSAAKTLLRSFEGTPIYKSISEVIDFVADTQKVGKSSLLKRIAVPPTPKIIVDNELWKSILNSLQENLIVEFDYKGRWNTENTHRRISPYQILLNNGYCFLFGYDLLKDAERLFSLNHMQNFIVTSEHFELPDNFEFSSRCGGGKFGAFITEDTYDFIIDFYDDSRPLVKECVWADNQKITELEDKTRIEFSSTQVMPIMEWILSQGANAVPISPDWFVNDWKKTINSIHEKITKLGGK